jgi:hypothetical protein
MKSADVERFLDFFREIDRRLGAERPARKCELYVLGGAAVVLAYGSRRATMDIDAYIADGRYMELLLGWAGAGSELERRHGLFIHGANTELMLIETPDWLTRSKTILRGKFKYLTVKVLSREDLVLSKLSRYNDRDRSDIAVILAGGIVKAKNLITRYRSARRYYAGNTRILDTTFNIVLKEYFGLSPITFG